MADSSHRLLQAVETNTRPRHPHSDPSRQPRTGGTTRLLQVAHHHSRADMQQLPHNPLRLLTLITTAMDLLQAVAAAVIHTAAVVSHHHSSLARAPDRELVRTMIVDRLTHQ